MFVAVHHSNTSYEVTVTAALPQSGIHEMRKGTAPGARIGMWIVWLFCTRSLALMGGYYFHALHHYIMQYINEDCIK